MAWQVEWLILWEMSVKMLTHIHMVVYTWWCWHICKGEEVGVDVDQLGEEMEAKGDELKYFIKNLQMMSRSTHK